MQAPTPTAQKPRIGVIGLGAMGAPMAQHLTRANPGKVTVTSRNPKKASDYRATHATWVPTNFEVGQLSDVVVTVLPDIPQLRAVLEGDSNKDDAGLLAGFAGREVLLVVCSTSSPEAVRKLAQELDSVSEGKIHLVDAPVSGGTEGAEAGRLSIMVGGDEADVALAISVLSACGTPVHLGPLGAGQVAKACNQLIVASTVLALGEAATVAARQGLDVEKMFDLLEGGYAGSRVLETKATRMAREEYEGGGTAKYMLKDMLIMQNLAESTGTNTVLSAPLLEAFQQLVEQGMGEQDICVTRKFIEER